MGRNEGNSLPCELWFPGRLYKPACHVTTISKTIDYMHINIHIDTHKIDSGAGRLPPLEYRMPPKYSCLYLPEDHTNKTTGKL